MSRGNDPAFPCPESSSAGDVREGMTLREHFAGLALQGLLATLTDDGNDTETLTDCASRLSLAAVAYADAILAALEKPR